MKTLSKLSYDAKTDHLTFDRNWNSRLEDKTETQQYRRNHKGKAPSRRKTKKVVDLKDGPVLFSGGFKGGKEEIMHVLNKHFKDMTFVSSEESRIYVLLNTQTRYTTLLHKKKVEYYLLLCDSEDELKRNYIMGHLAWTSGHRASDCGTEGHCFTESNSTGTQLAEKIDQQFN